MNGVARLEGGDGAPAFGGECFARLGRRETIVRELRLVIRCDDVDLAAETGVALFFSDGDAGMGFVFSAVDVGDFQCFVVGIFFLHGHRSEQATLVVLEGDFLADVYFGGYVVGRAEGDRNRPNRAIGQPHVFADADKIGFAHESGQRRKSADRDHFQIALLAWRERYRRQGGGVVGRLLGGGSVQYSVH